MSTPTESDPTLMAVQEPKSSWFSLSSLLTNQISNLSSSFIQVTAKMGAVANTLVERTLPQQLSTGVENEMNPEMTESKKDLTSKSFIVSID
jgi:hypothetical protein